MQSSNNPPEVLAIMHVEGSVPLKFALTRLPDGKSFVSCSHFFPLRMCRGRPAQLQSHARAALLSGGLLDYPFHPETVHADKVLDALKAWGTQAFNALFDRRDAGKWLSKASMLQIRSNDPLVLSWPWEKLFDCFPPPLPSGKRNLPSGTSCAILLFRTIEA